MSLFRRQMKVPPHKMAKEIWDVFIGILKKEIEQANQWDKEKFFEQNGYDYDKKAMIEEYPYIFIMIICKQIGDRFPAKAMEIVTEYGNFLDKNEMLHCAEGAEEYANVWNDAEIRSIIKDDNSPLNNPLYCVSKLASIR